MRVALFDFDGTLYPKETFNLLMESLKKHPKYSKNYKTFMRNFTPVYLLYKLKVIKTQKMKQDAMRQFIYAFKADSYDDLKSFFKDVGEAFIRDLRPSLMAQVTELQADNVKTFVVSGAYQELLDVIFDESFDEIIGTHVPIKDDKVDTKAPFTRLQSVEKVKMIQERLKGIDVDWHNSYAFSDSYEDINMLKLVGNVTVVEPDNRLRQFAIDNNWKVHEGVTS